MSNTMVITQPQPVMVSQDSDDWGTGPFDCLDDLPSCCFAFWCCPCFACKTSSEYGQPLCLPLLEIFAGFIPPITLAMRVSMRERYGIRGTMCMDCVCATFCTSCTWCQMSREIKKRRIPIVMVSAKNA
ncbi:cornifelin homolog B-like [Melanotaenia boesemani]|uniref:cornifelin homolog B-like n=1 Tax=Melanotaenia boesemani TaxID=1250792 RepID=UPI001C05316E|nr:cornifelin homolog B-like [Melanotaenia boesemani]